MIMHSSNYKYRHIAKQDHQNSMSNVNDNVTPLKTAVERSVHCKGAHAWNELPSGVCNIQTYDLFKTYQITEVLKMTKTIPVT